MMYRLKKHLSTLLGLFFLSSSLCYAASTEQFHLVVDVSGSMQRIDPQKERVSAIKQFIRELPEGSRAGIWTYAGQVNMLIAPSVVNEQWRVRATQAANTIGGYGPNANLTNALAQATHNWRHSPAQSGRHLIVLTDNGVVISGNESQAQIAQQRLMDSLVPQLQKSQISVSALALPHANASLLQTLAHDTKGSYYAVETPAAIGSALVSTVSDAPANAQTQVADVSVSAFVGQTESVVSEISATQTSSVIPAVSIENEAPVQTAVSTQALLVTPESVSQMPPATELGATEATEIKAQLAEAESKLQELMAEANQETLVHPEGMPTAAASLSGQQLAEPVVIPLQDGSVLVTPDQDRASMMANEANQSFAPKHSPAAQLSVQEMMSDTNQDMSPVTSDSAVFADQDIWPLILSILVVLNVVVIVLLFIGRYFWLRRKAHDDSSVYSTMNYGSVEND